MAVRKAVRPCQAPAVAGGFADHNPDASMLAGEGGRVSGRDGGAVGVLAWAEAEGKVCSKKAGGARSGGVHREQQASITAYLAEHGNQILPGQIITLAVAGDFWAHFPAGAEIGQNVFAKDTDGTLKASAAATETGHTLTRFKVASKAAAGELAKITTWE